MFMIVGGVLLLGWLFFMVRASIAEYSYYCAVAEYEPEIWTELGAPNYWIAPFLFLVTPHRKRLLDTIENSQVLAYQQRFKATGRLFLGYVIAVLISAIAFFTWA